MIHFVETDSKSLAVRPRVGAAAIRSHVMKQVRRREREEFFADIGDLSAPGAPNGEVAWRKHRTRSAHTRYRGARKVSGVQSSCNNRGPLDSEKPQGPGFLGERLMNRWVPDLLSISIDGGSAYRPVRVAKFAYGYFGRSAEASSGLMTTFSFWQSPQFHAMKAAGNALGLLYASTWLHDPQVLLEARKAHATAANMLRKEIEKPHVDFMAVLGAAEALISCEAYSLVSSGPTVTTTHLSGTMDVLRSTTHQTATASIRAFLFRKFRHLSLMQSLVSRRAFAGEHIWWLCSTVQPHGHVEQLMQLAVQLPGLLGMAEIVRRSCDPDERVLSGVRSRLCVLEIDLIEWLAGFDSVAVANPMEEDHNGGFATDVGVYWTQERPVITFPAICFSSFLIATCHAFSWVCLLLIRQALLCLPEHTNEHTIPRDLLADTDATADLLCASVPYLAKTAGGVLNKAVSVRAPLHFAGEWFEQTSRNEVKLQWCREREAEMQMQLPFLQW